MLTYYLCWAGLPTKSIIFLFLVKDIFPLGDILYNPFLICMLSELFGKQSLKGNYSKIGDIFMGSKKYFAIYWLILVCQVPIFFCCNSEKSKEQIGDNDKAKLIPTHEVKFPLDNQTVYRTYFVNTFNDSNQELLIFLSMNKPSLQFFDISNQTLVKEILLQKDGPNGVGSPTGALVLSWDSIFIVSSGHYLVSLINDDGNVVRSYPLLNGKSYNENTGMLLPFTIAPPIKIGSKIYFNVAPDRDVYKTSYYEGKTNLVLDVNTGEYAYFNSYPDEFKQGVWGVTATNFSTTFNPQLNKFVYSFAISDSLVLYNPYNNSSKRFNARSKLITGSLQPMIKPLNEHDLEYALETPYYGAIIYDKYRNLYYRFVSHSIPYKNHNGEINRFHMKPLSVIILDDNFNILGEIKLEENTYLDYIYFVSKEGLYISNGNPENPKLEDDFAVFTCFKVSDFQ